MRWVCIFGHDWTDWNEIRREAHLPDTRVVITRYQRRQCRVCKYIQEERISE